jgi:hypothetical protein
VEDCEQMWPSWWGKAFTLSHHFVLQLDTGTFSHLKIKVPLSIFDRLLFPEEITSGIPASASMSPRSKLKQVPQSNSKGLPLSTSRKLNVDAFTAAAAGSEQMGRRQTMVF